MDDLWKSSSEEKGEDRPAEYLNFDESAEISCSKDESTCTLHLTKEKTKMIKQYIIKSWLMAP